MKEQKGNFFEDFTENIVSNDVIATAHLKELEEELQEIDKNIENLELLKASLLRRKMKIETEPIFFAGEMNEQYKNSFSSKIVVENGMSFLTIKMPFKLPIYKKNIGKKYEYYKVMNYTYMIPMVNSILKALSEQNISFEDAFVLITHYTKAHTILDTDNRFHSFIFNALRSAKVISDDNHFRLAYAENGKVTGDCDAVRIIVIDTKFKQFAFDYNEITPVY